MDKLETLILGTISPKIYLIIQILEILNPIINSKSVWKSHALYLIAEYFYSKGEKQKSKEFFSQIITLENANLDILKETQKRLNRDLSE